MFLHMSVILFTGVGLPHCMLGYTPLQDQRQVPHLEPEAGTPLDQRQAPPGPEAGTLPGPDTPRNQPPTSPSAVHAGRYGQQAGGTHRTGMQSCCVIYLRRKLHEIQECIPVGCVLATH